VQEGAGDGAGGVGRRCRRGRETVQEGVFCV
jgi:hypothetical protein